MENPLQNLRNDIKKVSVKNLEAIADRRELEEKIVGGRAAEWGMEQAVAMYLAEKVANPHTGRAKGKDLEQFVEFLSLNGIETLGDLGGLYSVRLEKLCFVFLNERLNRAEKTSTAQRKRSSIRTFIQYLSHNFGRLIPHVPKMDNERFRETRSRGVTESLSFEEWVRLKDQLRTARNKELLPLVCFALLAGGRRISECLELSWSEIDFENRKINIRPRKKRKGDLEYLPLSDDLKPILEELRLNGADRKGFQDQQTKR